MKNTKRHINVWPSPKTWGGKWYQRKRILDVIDAASTITPVDGLFDVFGGGGTIVQNASHFDYRIYNDGDWFKVNYFEMLKNHPTALQAALQAYAYTEETFLRACVEHATFQRDAKPVLTFDEKLHRATAWFAKFRMSRAGKGDSFAIGTRTRGGKPGDINAWENAIARIPKTSQYWQGVYIMNAHFRDVFKLAPTHNGKWFYYYDPPYLPSVRQTKDVYDLEMSRNEHHELATTILSNQNSGFHAISSYRSDEYDTWFKGWFRMEYKIDSKVGQTKKKAIKTECIYCNFDPVAKRQAA